MGLRALRASVLACWLAAAVAGCAVGPTAMPAAPPSTPPARPASASALAPASPSATATPASTITLSGQGVGPLAFGAPEQTVVALLERHLGTPQVQGGVGGCEVAGSGYQSYATFGELRVRFAADDDSSTSPRTMRSWDVTFTRAPRAPLVLAPEIPVGRSLAELEALYPTGGGLEHMGAWVAQDVVLIPPSPESGETVVHAGDLDWCT